MKRRFAWFVLLFLACGPAVSPVLAKEKARIENLTIHVGEESLAVSFCARNCFTPKIEEIIQSGIPATLTLSVRLYQKRSFWKDKRLAAFKLIRTIRYDNIKKLYQVTFKEGEPTVVFEDFGELKRRVTQVENLRVMPQEQLKEGVIYYISVKARLEPVKLPFRLGNLFFLASSRKTQTDWLVQKFRVGVFVVPERGDKGE
ncbi:MAG: DUF4390 domain-containing protein [Deltaproteobacteria bacterium]|nr:DUF4390 domain-containing protein [Deltaproteobacteria bacterium]